MDTVASARESARTSTTRVPMKAYASTDPVSTAKEMLDQSFAPEAEALLDELERSGQFRVGLEAEQDEEGAEPAQSNDYAFGRGCGQVSVQDWWTTGRVNLHVGAGLDPA